LQDCRAVAEENGDTVVKLFLKWIYGDTAPSRKTGSVRVSVDCRTFWAGRRRYGAASVDPGWGAGSAESFQPKNFFT